MAWMLSFLLLMQSVAARPPQPDLPELIKRIQPSVVTVIVYDATGAELKRGSGFFIAGGEFVTSLHVLDGAQRAQIKTQNGQTFDVWSILADDIAADLVIGSTNPSSRELAQQGPWTKYASPDPPPLALSSVAPQIGESVVVIGSPFGLEQTVSTGIISALRTLPEEGDVLQITAPISPGSSGSPVLTLQGKVVGIVRSQLTKGQNLNFAAPANKIPPLERTRRTLAQWNIELNAHRWKSPQFTAAYNLAHNGNCRRALELFDEILQTAPTFSEAWFQKGYCHAQLGAFDMEATSYERVIAINASNGSPSADFVFYDLGLAYVQLNRDIDAKAAFEKALVRVNPIEQDLHRSDVEFKSYVELGDLNNRLGARNNQPGRFFEAVEDFKRAIALKPQDWYPFHALGMVYNNVQRYFEAIDAEKQAIRLAPPDKLGFPHYDLGYAFAMIGNRTAAMEEYYLLRRLDPSLAATLLLSLN